MKDVQSNHKRVVLQCLQWIGGRHLPYLLSSKGLKRGNGPGWLQSTSAGDSKGYFTTWRRSCVLTLQPIDRIFVWHQRRWTTSCQWLVQISSDRTPITDWQSNPSKDLWLHWGRPTHKLLPWLLWFWGESRVVLNGPLFGGSRPRGALHRLYLLHQFQTNCMGLGVDKLQRNTKEILI